MFFGQVSSLIAAVVPLEIIKLMPSIQEGYVTIGFFFGVLYAFPYLLIFLKTNTRIEISKEPKTAFSIKEFVKPFKIKSYRYLMGIYLFSFLSMDLIATVFAYYMNYFLHRPLELNYVLGTLLIIQIFLIPLVIFFANKIEKKQTLQVSVVLWIAGILLLASLTPEWPGWTIYGIAVLMGSGIIGCIVAPWIMYPDVTDVGELAFGKRTAGSLSGIMTFLRKFSAAIGIFIVSQILDIAGYNQPVEKHLNGSTTKILQEQPEEVIIALKVIVGGFPLILLVFVYWFAKKYPITFDIHSRLSRYLEWKRGNLKSNPLNDTELKELESELI